jgi:hypothetical protein
MKARDRYFVEGVRCVVDGRSMRVANLGLGGFFAATDQLPLPHQIVSAELLLPHGRCRLAGVVSWINDPARPAVLDLPAGFGLQITAIDAADRERILEVLRVSEPVLGDPRRRRAS